MAIVHLGAKRVQGVKSDRLSDSLGSSVDGTNTGIAVVATPSYSASDLSWNTSASGQQNMSYSTTDNANQKATTTSHSNWESLAISTKSHTANASTSTEFQYKLSVESGSVHDWMVGLSSTPSSSYGTGNITAIWTVGHYQSQVNGNNKVYVGSTQGTNYTTNTATTTYTLKISGLDVILQYNGANIHTFTNALTSGSTYYLIASGNGGAGNGFTLDDTKIQKLGTGAYNFDGTNDSVTFGSASDWTFLNDGTSWSIAWWQNSNVSSGDQQMFGTMDDGSGSNRGISIFNKGNGHMGFSSYNGTSGQYPFSTDTIANSSMFDDTGVWHHYAVVYDSSTEKLYVYKDGSLQNSGGTSKNSASFSTSAPQSALKSGERVSSNNRDLNAKLDDIGIWKRVLTATEISDLVNKTDKATDVTDDLTTDKGWVSNTSDWSYNATNDTIDLATIRRSTTAQRIYIDLQDSDYLGSGNNLSDTSWVIRLGKFKVNALASGANVLAIVCLSDSLDDSGTNQDAVGFDYGLKSTELFIRLKVIDGVHFQGGGQSSAGFSSSTVPSTTTSYRWELSRNGNVYTMKAFAENDTTYSTPLETETVTKTGITGLRYLKIINDSEQNNSATADMEIFGDIKIWNGTTSASTNDGALVSSLSDKANLKAYYSMNSTALTSLKGSTDFDDDFSGTDDWIDRGTTIAVDTTNDRINYDVGNGSGTGNNATYYDLGVGNVSNTKWTLRWKTYIGSAYSSDSSASSSHMGVGITKGGADMTTFAYNDLQDSIMAATGSGDGGGEIYYNHYGDNANSLDTSNRDVFSRSPDSDKGEWVWNTLKRESPTKMNWTIRSTSHTGTVLESKTTTIASGIAGLRYIAVQSRQQNANSHEGYIDDIEFYNDSAETTGCKNDFSSTSALDGQTNLPVNTIFEQIDDTPTYYWKQSDNTWKIDGTLPTPDAWWDMSASDTTISNVTDKTGNGNTLVQSTSSKRPSVASSAQNGLNALQFDENNEYLYTTDTMTLTPKQTIFYVGKIVKGTTNTGWNFYVWDGDGIHNSLIQFQNNWRLYDADFGDLSETSWSRWLQLTVQFNGSSSFLRDNGVQTDNPDGVLKTENTRKFILNGYTNSGGYGGANTVGEVIIYNRMLNSTEIEKVETYLKDKWGTP